MTFIGRLPLHCIRTPTSTLRPVAPTSILGKISLVIAVTGHRDLAADPVHLSSIRERLAAFLKKQADLYPNTPILVIAGMAEGADQLAIEVVRKLEHPRITYRPILPMPQEIFLLDFTSDESRALFQEQIAGQSIVELPIDPNHTLDDLLQKNKDARAQQFRRLSNFLIESSQILVAIWDDDSPARAGGTTEIVQQKLGTEPLSSFYLSHSELTNEQCSRLSINSFGTGSVFHIFARRTGARLYVRALENELLLPRGTTQSDFQKIYLLMDEYNFDVATHPGLAEVSDTKARALNSGGWGQDLSPAMLWCQTVRGWSAALAEHYQVLNRRLLKTIFLLILLLGLAIHLVEPFSKNHARPFEADLVVFLLSAGGILILFALDNGYLSLYWRLLTGHLRGPRPPDMPAGGLKIRRKHEDYRALAEALRVQFYWFAAGMSDLAANSYLDKHAGDMIWVRDATSEALLALYEKDSLAIDGNTFSHSLARSWLEGQVNYFREKGVAAERAYGRLNLFAWVTAVPTFLCPVVLFAFFHSAAARSTLDELTTGLSLIAGLLLLVSVILWNFAEISGYEQESQQARQMHRLFGAALQQLDALIFELNSVPPDAPEREKMTSSITKQVRNLLQQIGKDALIENGDWLALHRGRDFKLNRTTG